MTENTPVILIADDDEFVRGDLEDMLCKDYRLLFSKTAKETWETIDQGSPDLVLLDINFPDCQDLSLLRRIKSEAPLTEVIILSNQFSNVGQIVEAVKIGAFDFVAKPFQPEELKNRIAKGLLCKNLRDSQADLVRELAKRSGLEHLIGSSEIMQNVRGKVRKLANAKGSILIQGESGTGKELVARALHQMSFRHNRPFEVVNCAAIPETLVESELFGHKKGAFTGAVESSKGKFELAKDGTLFLDEIGEMPLAQQSTLLRVLEYREFSPVGDTRKLECRARLIFATNRDLQQCVREKTFREDLFYRINVGTINLPPLRARKTDIPELVGHYCKVLSDEMGRAPMTVHRDVLDLFQAYDWPGNVRELRNALEAAAMLLDLGDAEIGLEDVPAQVQAGGACSPKSPDELTPEEQDLKRALLEALQQSNGNQSVAAKILNCHRNTVRARMRAFGIAEN